MTTTAVEDEYNALFKSPKIVNCHPEDDSSTASDGGSTTLAPTTGSNATTVYDSRSLRSGGRTFYRSHNNSSDEEDSDSDADGYHARTQKSSTYYLPSAFSPNANTGPKGVIADAQAFEKEKRGVKTSSFGRTRDLALPKHQKARRAVELPRKTNQRDTDSTWDDEILEEDEEQDSLEEGDDYMDKWRRKRIGELRAIGGKGGSYGGFRVVDANGYLDAIEGAPPRAVVLVYIYDDALRLSQEYQSHLEALASKYSNVRFIALHFEDAEMEPAGVPAILAYRNGDKIAGIVPLTEEVPATGDVTSNLEQALQRLAIPG